MDSIRKQEPQPLRYILLCQQEQEGLASIDPHFVCSIFPSVFKSKLKENQRINFR